METANENNSTPEEQFDAHRTALEMFCSDITASAKRLGLPYHAELHPIPGLPEYAVHPYLVDEKGLEEFDHLLSGRRENRVGMDSLSKIPGYYCDDIFKTIDIQIHVAADGTVKVFDISEKEEQIFK
jgi:hypothetical protein